MAEVLCREMVAKRLGCPLDELEDPSSGKRGVIVMSAGIAAMMGGRAAAEAVQTAAAMGLDLSNHETQPLTDALMRHADAIYAMTRSHREAIVAQWPDAAERTHVLSVDGSDIADPIGGPLERYQRCAEQIRLELAARLDELKLNRDN
jgi:protein-tyrosine phosphatase